MEGFGDTVSTPHHLATQAAIDLLAQGGNAADAMLAANAVLGVVAPETCGIGGDLFALVWEPGASIPAALNASGPAGSGADAAGLRAAGHTAMPYLGTETVTVPGCVAGWQVLADRCGKLALEDVLQPAGALAEEGFPASRELVRVLEARADTYLPQPAAQGLYPKGKPPAVGDRLHRPDLASTLGAIASGGADGFYQGTPAADVSAATGGRLTVDDLASFAPVWVDPLRMELFGHTGWTVPPNSQGYLTLATLKVFESLGVDPEDPARTHLLVESYRSVAAHRDGLLADPDFLPGDFAGHFQAITFEKIAAGISPDRAGVYPRPRGVPGGTAYMCAIDESGMGVSLMQSNFSGMGAGIGAGRSGFFLHNRGAGFNLIPGHPNELAPGKRPLHTLSPSLWTKGGHLAAVLGTRGGHQQPQLVAQVAAETIGAGRAIDHAQEAARWTLDEFGPGQESHILIEDSAAESLVDGLALRGHRVTRRARRESGWGPVSMIRISENGLRTTARDPRVSTTSTACR